MPQLSCGFLTEKSFMAISRMICQIKANNDNIRIETSVDLVTLQKAMAMARGQIHTQIQNDAMLHLLQALNWQEIDTKSEQQSLQKHFKFISKCKDLSRKLFVSFLNDTYMYFHSTPPPPPPPPHTHTPLDPG